VNETFILYAGVIAVPLLFLTLRTIFAWSYRRTVRKSMRGGSETPRAAPEPRPDPEGVRRPPLAILPLSAREFPLARGPAETLHGDATAATRDVQRAVMAAAVVYSALISVSLNAAFEPQIPLDARLTAVYLVQPSILLIVWSVLSLAPKWLGLIAAGYAIGGFLAMHGFASTSRIVLLIGAERDLFLILPIAGLMILVQRRLRPLLVGLGAIGLYLLGAWIVAVVLSELGVSLRGVRWWIAAIGALYTLLGFFVFAWLLRRRSLRSPIAILATAGGLGLLIEFVWNPQLPIGAMLAGLPLNVLQIYIVWLIFRLILRFHDRHLMPGQLIHSHMLFAFLSVYFVTLLYASRDAALFGEEAWPLATIGAAFVCQGVVLHVLLRRAWRDRRVRPPKRLLLLRVFGSVQGPERLLDLLEDSWRRLGRIDLIGATDLAMDTLGSRMLEAFLLKRVDKQFLKTDQDVIRRLGRLRSSLEGDLRYPLNEIYCQGDTWQRAVRELALEADAVLMDLRTFSIRNRGCAYELRELVHHIPLRRILLLADRATDMQGLEAIARTAWLELPAASPNATDTLPRLRVLPSTGSRMHDAKVLFRMLLDATAEPARAPIAS